MKNIYASWYEIARRFVFIAPAYLFRVLFCLCILLGWGLDDARRAWSDTA